MNAIGSQLYKVPNGRSCVKWEAELDPLSVVEAAASVFDEETEFVPPDFFRDSPFVVVSPRYVLDP